jgi:hypothetical protein
MAWKVTIVYEGVDYSSYDEQRAAVEIVVQGGDLERVVEEARQRAAAAMAMEAKS